MMKRWQDPVNLVLGVWTFVSPLLLQYATANETAAWNAYILGVAIVLFSAFALYMPKVWEEVVNILLGIWLIISPWVLGFTTEREAMMNAVIVGALVTAFAMWAMAYDAEFKKWWQEHGPGHTT